MPGVLAAIIALVLGWTLWRSVGAIRSPRYRASMVASGIAIASLLAGDAPNAVPVEVAYFLAYWVVNTAILGMVIEGMRWQITHRRMFRTTLGAFLACALALATAGCLAATPPKTPNQREAERNAPQVAVPTPPDAGRTPRPAGADPG